MRSSITRHLKRTTRNHEVHRANFDVVPACACDGTCRIDASDARISAFALQIASQFSATTIQERLFQQAAPTATRLNARAEEASLDTHKRMSSDASANQH